VVAQQDDFARAHHVDAFARIRSIADDVAQAIGVGDVVLLDIREHGLERFEIAVDIADQRFHELGLPRPGTWHAGGWLQGGGEIMLE
jgi:hypothetical protein